MNIIPSPACMMDAHIHLNLDVYFSNISSFDRIKIATSEIIEDHYWNYAFTCDGAPFNEDELEVATVALKKSNRHSVIWQPSDRERPSGWTPISEEAWMWISSSNWAKHVWKEAPAGFNVQAVSQATTSMREVFEDAYGSGKSEGEVGYFCLPPEYGNAYIRAVGRKPAKFQHFTGVVDGNCVAIGTASIWNGIGGIYSVGTCHSYRRLGFGRFLSQYATDWAIENGASGVLLQTIADSPVENMYNQLGYRRTHSGVLLEKQ